MGIYSDYVGAGLRAGCYQSRWYAVAHWRADAVDSLTFRKKKEAGWGEEKLGIW